MQKNNCYFTDANTRPPAVTIKPRLTVMPQVLVYSAHQVNKYRRGLAKAASPQTNQTPPTATTSASRQPQPHPTTSNPTSNDIQPPQSQPTTTTTHTHTTPTPHPMRCPPPDHNKGRPAVAGGMPEHQRNEWRQRKQGRKGEKIRLQVTRRWRGVRSTENKAAGAKKTGKKNKYAPSLPHLRC